MSGRCAGIPIEESLQTALKWLEDDGGLTPWNRLQVLAGESDVPVPRRCTGPRSSPPTSSPRSQLGRVRMSGNKFFREYPYRGAYLMRDAESSAPPKLPIILLGGITNRDTMDKAMAAGFDFVAMGRALLAEPTCSTASRRTRGAVHLAITLQSVHADHLQPPRTAW